MKNTTCCQFIICTSKDMSRNRHKHTIVTEEDHKLAVKNVMKQKTNGSLKTVQVTTKKEY